MPNTPSAAKRLRQSKKRRERNRVYRSRARTLVKRIRRLIDEDELDEAEEQMVDAVRALDKAASKGVIHKNKAARDKSRLMKRLHAAQEAAGSPSE